MGSMVMSGWDTPIEWIIMQYSIVAFALSGAFALISYGIRELRNK